MSNYILIFFIALSGLFGALSYHFSNAKAEAEQALVQVIDANTALEKSLNLRDLSCKIDTQVTTEFQQEKQAKDVATESVLSKLSKIPVVQVSVPKSAQPIQGAANETDVVNIDSKLPADIIGMLQSHCDSNKGSACTNP